jgi:multidrug efflux pump subunit AcrA (membrane-fusion protein)
MEIVPGSTQDVPGRRTYRLAIAAAIVVAIVTGAWFTRSYWRGMLQDASSGGEAESAPHSDEAEHGHAHGASSANEITLSDRGLKNIGFVPVTVTLQSFERTESLPAIVVEQPGRTQIQLSSPFGGVLAKVFVVQGEAIEPGSPMFEVRLTHEELVTSQQEFLKTAENLEIVDREISRLEALSEGVVAGKRILEQQYEKQKLEVSLRSAEQALLLHGLTSEQVQEILKTRQLLQSVTVFAPSHSHASGNCPENHAFHVQRLPVSPGQQVDASQELAVLADHCELYLEGRAFEDDALQLRNAAREGWTISASLLTGDKDAATIDNLKLLYLGDTIDPETRAFRFYLQLPNKMVLDQKTPDGRRFIDWEFKPGQRFELHVPIEKLTDRIVAPIEAVVEEGAEFYVYRQNGKNFDRVPVHVEYRDNKSAVIANDGALFPGDIIAGRGAYQMHLALKNKSGGGVDPHAGHNH